MAKQPKETKAPTTSTSPESVKEPTTTTEGTTMATEPKTEGAPSTALVPANQNTAVITPADSNVARNKALADRLPPQYREDVLFMIRPTPEQFFDIVTKMPGDSQGAMMELIKKTRPKKQGAHTSNEGFSPTQLRVNQGTGNDQAKPPKHPPGNFYSADSRDMNDEIECVVLGFYEGRTMWPPRDAGDSSGGKAPLCYSFDRKMGSRYGECASCPNASKKYTDGGCTREVTAWVMDRAMTGIYEVKFSKSSIGGGEAMMRVMKTAKFLWERWFTVKNEVRTEGDRRWYVTTAKPYSDPKNPNATFTDAALHPLFENLSRLMDADVYFPALADTYDRSKNSTDAGGAVSAGVDEAKLLGNSATDGTPDYSGDNPNV